eukprot:7372829-Pyramimonas_sp.AAC.1
MGGASGAGPPQPARAAGRPRRRLSTSCGNAPATWGSMGTHPELLQEATAGWQEFPCFWLRGLPPLRWTSGPTLIDVPSDPVVSPSLEPGPIGLGRGASMSGRTGRGGRARRSPG